MLAIARHSLANVLRALGEVDQARDLFAASLETYRQLDDRWGLAFLLEDIALLAVRAGDPAAGLRMLGAADRVRADNELPRAPGHERELSAEIEPARAALGTVAERAVSEGRDWGFATAIDAARGIVAPNAS
jgi:hypothetical protein